MDDLSILNVADTGCPPNVKWGYVVPPQLRSFDPYCLPTDPLYVHHHANNGALDAGKWENRDGGEELCEGCVEVALDEDLVDLVFADLGLVAGFRLSCVAGRLHQLEHPLANDLGIRRLGRDRR